MNLVNTAATDIDIVAAVLLYVGDKLNNRAQADNHISKDAFQAIIKERAYADFELDYTIQQDVSDFSQINYDQLISLL